MNGPNPSDALHSPQLFFSGGGDPARHGLTQTGCSELSDLRLGGWDLVPKKDVEEPASVKTAERKSQFKVVAKRDSAILPQLGNPSGWVTKVQERAEAAGTGESWHLDAFAIV
ncbi:hypothetical protein H4582DRAFT_2097701 [Lactarius indigo]|nr:hypothetical protein H4582DRAFT_2097701 [Lactarius indigo]